MKLTLYSSLLLLSLLGNLPSFSQSVVLNEVVFANSNSLTDADGDTPDWIELYNSDTVAVNLKNFQLTDDISNSTHWTFPDYTLPSNGYLIVFASGKNRKKSEEFHTDFKLGLMEEQLFLLNPSGTAIDSTGIRCVPRDKSLACIPDGARNSRFVATPTPQQSNNQTDTISINYRPDSLILSDAGGFYGQPIELSMSNTHQQNKIYYTLDGNDPDTDELEYNAPIDLYNITSNEIRFADEIDNGFDLGNDIFKAPIVRAQVFSEGCPASKTISNTYFIGLEKNPYNVPVSAIITDKDNLFDDDEGIYVEGNNMNFARSGQEWERDIHVEMFDEAGTAIIKQDAGMRIHGRGSRRRPQKSLRLYAKEKFGHEYFNYPFFEQKPHITRVKRMLLRSITDMGETLIKDELAQELVSTMNTDYTAARASVVFINGEYWGIYSMRERQDEYYVADNYSIPKTDLSVVAYTLAGVEVEEGPETDYTNLTFWLETNNPKEPGFYAQANEKIDLDALIDYHSAQIYFANFDFPANNLRMWRLLNDTARWRYFFYDCDACMKRVEYNILSEYSHNSQDYQTTRPYSTYVLRRMLQNPEFAQRFRARLLYHLSNTFSPERVLNLIDEWQETYAPLIPEHTYRWNSPTDYLKWQKNVEQLKSFAIQRPMVVKQDLLDQFSSPLIISPNPTKGVFKVEALWSSGNAQMRILNTTGQTVHQETFIINENAPQQFHTTLSAGLYIIEIESGGFRFSEKLVVVSN
ncbi:MAG: CotH kinase family protein [Salinivirgaceae bacterium]